MLFMRLLTKGRLRPRIRRALRLGGGRAVGPRMCRLSTTTPIRTGLQFDTQLTTASVKSSFGLLFTRTFPLVTPPS